MVDNFASVSKLLKLNLSLAWLLLTQYTIRHMDRSSSFVLHQGRRNKGGKEEAALPIFLNYSSKYPFLRHQYFRILVVCPTNI